MLVAPGVRRQGPTLLGPQRRDTLRGVGEDVRRYGAAESVRDVRYADELATSGAASSPFSCTTRSGRHRRATGSRSCTIGASGPRRTAGEDEQRNLLRPETRGGPSDRPARLAPTAPRSGRPAQPRCRPPPPGGRRRPRWPTAPRGRRRAAPWPAAPSAGRGRTRRGRDEDAHGPDGTRPARPYERLRLDSASPPRQSGRNANPTRERREAVGASRCSLMPLVLSTAACGVTRGEDTRDLLMIIPNSPGGGYDQTGRAAVGVMEKDDITGGSFTVDNVIGAGGAAAMTQLIGEAGDEHTDDDGRARSGGVDLLVRQLVRTPRRHPARPADERARGDPRARGLAIRDRRGLGRGVEGRPQLARDRRRLLPGRARPSLPDAAGCRGRHRPRR